MNLNILGSSYILQSDAEKSFSLPQFRKATKNMVYATLALQKAILPMQEFFDKNKMDFSLILSSKTGELETTLDFLNTFYGSGLARPLLFQNSLHNATAGYVAIQAGITGAVLSISPSPFGEEQALELAKTLIMSKQSRYCIVLSVDVWPTFNATDLLSKEGWDGGSCLILTGTEERGIPIKAKIKSFSFDEIEKLNLDSKWESLPQSQNIIFSLSKALESEKCGKLEIQKKQGQSTLEWDLYHDHS